MITFIIRVHTCNISLKCEENSAVLFKKQTCYAHCLLATFPEQYHSFEIIALDYQRSKDSKTLRIQRIKCGKAIGKEPLRRTNRGKEEKMVYRKNPKSLVYLHFVIGISCAVYTILFERENLTGL